MSAPNITGLNDLALQIALINQANGWQDSPIAFGDDIANLHSEVSEAWEEYRSGHKPSERYYSEPPDIVDRVRQPRKPEGIPSELADVIIRVLDIAYRYGVDMDAVLAEKLAHNATRGHRHGGKVV